MSDQHVRSVGDMAGLSIGDSNSFGLCFGDLDESEWGSFLRTRREELGLFQQELAMLAGVSARYVHMLEAGKSTVRLDTLSRVLETLGLGLTVELRAEPIAVTVA